eukprot:CAMPEP_0176026044 /NCGR_PEP_ID=MMETSP0120_2-20121206/12752_1 /TAXON_ID=160619 /ORGANISM="Kryptoperidinium foliaceum, Strain CCMP 1326" /LENGTH=84 /DNA_ID=CAMNT_0017359237 /DNA_START=332 /DNA_END=583 /DNA_ORIENTATION=+
MASASGPAAISAHATGGRPRAWVRAPMLHHASSARSAPSSTYFSRKGISREPQALGGARRTGVASVPEEPRVPSVATASCSQLE